MAVTSILTGWIAVQLTLLLNARDGSMLTLCLPLASASDAGRSWTLVNEQTGGLSPDYSFFYYAGI